MKLVSMPFQAIVGLVTLAAVGMLPAQGTEGRSRENFDNDWRFARFGLQADGSRLPESADAAAENQAEPGQTSSPAAPAFDDAVWRKLDVPHDWGIEGPFHKDLAAPTGKLPWKGIGWYRKAFTLPAADAGKRIFVDFDGAMAYAQVWCNGHYVGGWPYGYASFRLDLTPHLKFGQTNLLAVRLDTEKWDARWYPGAGIYRHVWLVKTAPVHVGHWGVSVTTPEVTAAAATVKLAVTVDNPGDAATTASVVTEIYELDAKGLPNKKVAVSEAVVADIAAGANATVARQVVVTQPKLWNLTTPNRHLARTSVSVSGKVVDVCDTPFGIRSIQFTARDGFLLNGKRVEIRGTCNHHDLGALGAAINNRALERQLEILKAMGCNALRTSHNPPAPELLDLADRMGFLVWDEAFDCWIWGKMVNDYNQLWDGWHVKDLQALVRRDRNHPSVIIWSIGNEVVEQTKVDLTKHLADVVRAEDPARPVSNGYNNPDGGRDSGAAKQLDLMGINYGFGSQERFDKDPRYKDMPTVGSETSSCVSTRGEYFFGKNRDHWQVSSYDCDFPPWGCTPDTQFATLERLPHVLGEFVWTGFDYLGEPTPYAAAKGAPPRSSYFGIIDLAGFPKDRYYNYQAHWRPDLPMVHIFPHWNWPERVGQVTPVHVYTSGGEAELFLNGTSLGRLTKQPKHDYRLVWKDVKYAPGELKVVAYKDGKPWASETIKTTGPAAGLQLAPDRATVTADGLDLSFVTVRIADKDGLTVPRSNNSVDFKIEGPGEVVAVDNGDPTSFEPFQASRRRAFNGLALVVVRAKRGQAGTLTLKATSDGLEPASIKIKSCASPPPCNAASPSTGLN